MSQTSPETSGVSLDKPAAGGASATPPRRGLFGGGFGAGAGRTAPADVPAVPVPRVIDVACGLMLLAVVATFLRAIGLMTGSTSQLTDYYRTHQSTSKGSKPLTAAQIADQVHNVRAGSWINLLLLAFVMALLGFSLRKTRSASGSRWALLIVGVLVVGLPFSLIPITGWPVLAAAGTVLSGVATLAAIVLLFASNQARDYFKACRAAVLPPGAAGQPRPGLFSMLAGRRQPGAGAATRPATRPASTRPADGATDSAAGSRPRSKVRADADSIAKGAQLARSRAKASKSRRTE